MASFMEHIKSNKKIYKIVIGGVVVSLIGGSLLWYGTRKNAYALSVDGKVVAVIKEKEQAKVAYEELVASLKDDIGVDIAVNETLELEPVHSKASEINTYDELAKALSDTISYGVEAYEILVDGESRAVINSREAASTILEEIAKKYLPNSGSLTLDLENITEEDTAKENEIKENKAAPETTPVGDVAQEEDQNQQASSVETVEVEDALPHEEVVEQVTVGNVAVDENTVEKEETEETEGQKIERVMQELDFNETVTVRNVYVEQEDVLTEEVAKETLLGKRYTQKSYELQEGDNIWDLAIKNGITMERILELNPQIEDETKMQIGDVITLEVASPILSISTVEEATFKELIPSEVEYVEFSDLYEGETKIYQEGHDGLKELTVEVTKTNGVEVGRKLLEEKTLKEAKTQVIAFGTKKKPVVIQKPSNSNTTGSGSNVNSGSGSGSSSGSGSGSGSTSNNKPPTNDKPSGSPSSSYIRPLKGAGYISSDYGSRWGSFHKGIDFAAPAGTPIYAVADGKVIYSGYNNGGYGKLIIIEHSNGTQTYYAHCSSLYVNVGAYVSQGQNIAGVGSTGDSTGNHVHFEVRKNGTPVNPWNYIS